MAGDVRIEPRRAKTERASGQGVVNDSRPRKGVRKRKLDAFFIGLLIVTLASALVTMDYTHHSSKCCWTPERNQRFCPGAEIFPLIVTTLSLPTTIGDLS